MAHEVETMMSVREVPWHGHGTIVADKLTAKDALVAAGLDWEVELKDIFLNTGKLDGTTTDVFMPVEGRKAVVRDIDGSVFEIVSDGYEPIQNWKSFEFFDEVVGSGEAKYDTAGSLSGGRKIFLTATVPKDIKIGGVDPVDLYLAMANSHDRSLAFTAMITPVRVVCKNTLNLALSKNGPQSWKLKHHDGLDGKVLEARKALDMTFSYAEEFQAEMDVLIAQDFDTAEFESLIKDVFPNKGRGEYSAEHYSMIGVFQSSPTMDDSFRFTKWGALNAVREWDDWGKSLRVGEGKSLAEAQVSNTLFGPNVKRSNLVLAALQA